MNISANRFMLAGELTASSGEQLTIIPFPPRESNRITGSCCAYRLYRRFSSILSVE